MKIWWADFPAKRCTLSSMDGQYLGPTPWIAPVNIGDRSRAPRMISWVRSFVCVIQHGSCRGCISRRPTKEKTGSGESPGCSPMAPKSTRSEEHTSELQSHVNLVCRLLL